MSMKLQPLVSVIIPFYNQNPQFLRQCIDSVISQTYLNIDIIVSDNHSNNGCAEVLNEYSDRRLRIVQPPQHMPLVPHFQWASEQASGEYISFLSSDDWMEKECIDELVKLVQQHPGVVMAFCSVKQYFNGKKANFINVEPGMVSSNDEIQSYVRISKIKASVIGCILSKSVYQKVGGIGNGDINFAADRWLLIQMAMNGGGAYVNKPYAVFRNENPTRKDRVYVYSEDLLKLFDLIEKNCLPRIEGGQRTVDKERTKLALNFLKSLPAYARSGSINDQDFRKALENIRKLGRSKLVEYIVRLYGNKQLVWAASVLFYLTDKFNNALFKVKNKLSLQP
jgi:glycosyltransferase involved in cell wall biosynthesis